MDLLPEQKQAIKTLDKNLCVTAGAGSGKTTILTKRYLNILASIDNISFKNILSLTFSEEASQEMKRRILEVNKEKEDIFLLQESYISTIHAFCYRVLRENVLESALDPNFRVADEITSNILLQKTVDLLFEKLYKQKAKHFFTLLDNFPLIILKSAIIDIYKKLQCFDLKNIILSDYNQKKEIEIKKEIHKAIDILANTSINEKISAALENKIKDIKENINPTICSILKNIETPSFWQNIKILSNIKINKYSKMDAHYKESIDNFHHLIKKYQAFIIEKKSQPFQQAFQELIKSFSEIYENQKKQLNILDFDSLQILTKDLLLKNKEIKTQYQKQFKYILIDEYQDVNQLQAHLIDLLAQKSNLFIVGDQKQAIYGFRNADDGLLQNKRNLYLSNEKNNKVISLNTNFRSNKEILIFINNFFSWLWQDKKEYLEPLKPHHKNTRLKPVVNCLLVSEEKTEAFIQRYKESKAIVKQISDSVEKLLINKEANKHQKLKYSDIAILLRSFTSINIYEQALKEKNIPYTIVRSGNFYSREEIIDVYNFLGAIISPEDNFTMATLLKSPFVSITDNTLFWLFKNKEKIIYKNLNNLTNKISANEQKKLSNFLKLFKGLLAKKTHCSIAETIDSIIRETQYIEYLLLQHNGLEKIKNLEKLMQIALNYSEQTSPQLEDFLNYLKVLIDENVNESEVKTLDNNDNSIKIMTIHKSKGLEFPMVIIADLQRNLKSSQSTGNPLNITINGKLGCCIKGFKSTTYLENDSYISEKEQLESKRLLYVACTRAKEYLVLAGITPPEKISSNKNNSSYGDLFGEWLRKFSENFQNILKIKQIDNEIKKDKSIINDKENPLFINEILNLKPLSSLQIKEKDKKTFKNILLQCQPLNNISTTPLNLSITQMVNYIFCPRYFYLRHDLGLPDDWIKTNNKTPPLISDQETNKLFSKSIENTSTFGNITHNILELYDFKRTLDQQWTEISEIIPSEYKASIKNIINNFLRTELAKKIKQGKYKKETSFIIPINNHFLHGKIDLLLQTLSNEFWIIDYKTGHKPRENSYNMNNYIWQQKLYALAVYQINKKLPEKTILYFLKDNKSHQINITKDIIKKTTSKTIESLEKINQGFFPKNTYNCQHCYYKKLCS